MRQFLHGDLPLPTDTDGAVYPSGREAAMREIGMPERKRPRPSRKRGKTRPEPERNKLTKATNSTVQRDLFAVGEARADIGVAFALQRSDQLARVGIELHAVPGRLPDRDGIQARRAIRARSNRAGRPGSIRRQR